MQSLAWELPYMVGVPIKKENSGLTLLRTCNYSLPWVRYLKKYQSISILRLYPQHMEIPRLGVELELQLPAYATATATWDPSGICDMGSEWYFYTTAHSNAGSLTHWARTGIKPVSSWILVRFINHWAMKGTSPEASPLYDKQQRSCRRSLFVIKQSLGKIAVIFPIGGIWTRRNTHTHTHTHTHIHTQTTSSKLLIYISMFIFVASYHIKDFKIFG